MILILRQVSTYVIHTRHELLSWISFVFDHHEDRRTTPSQLILELAGCFVLIDSKEVDQKEDFGPLVAFLVGEVVF